MPRIVVKDSHVHERNINGQNGPRIIREQRACIDQGDGYELPFRIGLGTGPVYPVGSYDLDPECFSLGKYGDLELSRYIKLKPLAPPLEVAARKTA